MKAVRSRLMEDMKRLIRLVSVVLIPLGILLLLKQTLLNHLPLAQAVPPTVAAMLGMIPEGLMLLTVYIILALAFFFLPVRGEVHGGHEARPAAVAPPG